MARSSTLLVSLLAACGTPQEAPVIDAGPRSADGAPAPRDAGAADGTTERPTCPSGLAGAFDSSVRPYLDRCIPCHNSTVPAEWLHSGGPQWFDPDDAGTTVGEILSRGLVDRGRPRRSLFRLKPLTRSGVSHAGGDLFLPGSETDQAFIDLLEHAAPCAPRGRPLPGFP